MIPDQDPEDNVTRKDNDTPVIKMSSASCIPQGMTLEALIDLTEELEHLNELVMLHLENEGGFTTPESYFAMVQPILDLLEFEIRVRSSPGMTRQAMKLIIQDWIDEEIAECKRKKRINETSSP